MTLTKPVRAVPTLSALLLSAPAFAHPGHLHMSGFLAGVFHPLSGLDHLAAMLMVGLWAGTAFRSRLAAPPIAFVAFMLTGFAYGASGGQLPLTEFLILGSVIVLGALLLFEITVPLAVASGMIALFAFAHGRAHGAEMPAQTNALGFATGFAVTTTLLHIAGIGLASLANRPASRLIGGGVAALGTIWIFAT